MQKNKESTPKTKSELNCNMMVKQFQITNDRQYTKPNNEHPYYHIILK